MRRRQEACPFYDLIAARVFSVSPEVIILLSLPGVSEADAIKDAIKAVDEAETFV